MGGTAAQANSGVLAAQSSFSVPMREKPSKSSCDKAIKLLTQVIRLSEKYKVNLSQKRKKELQAKINNGTITSNDLPGKIQAEFPGEFKGKSLNEIKKECGVK
ncbi:hypothetical protein FEK35_28315 [Nocardia cyriacigeorgica]|uniref:Uncharacterized protein n=1 Tax=Nocardia cyriacigeorgica TaxID=135487 RepID=A0A5R8P863_9NOCA|nr:hypothetical protein [Nocardia cyriacigeorgica]TLF96655.1 hypothetical protein FEK35_28315 [Nocardia cyriacigeorgica]